MDKTKTKDIAIRVVSVVLAFILWIYVESVKNPYETRIINDVPITVVNTESLAREGYTIITYQKTISVSVKGTKKDLDALNSEDLKAEANLGVGSHIRGSNLVLVELKGSPKGIEIPNQALYITAELDEIVQQSFPVKVEPVGTPKQGYSNMDPVVKPSEVLIKGASRYISSINSVVVKPDIKDLSIDTIMSLPVQLLDKDGKPVYEGADEASKVDTNPGSVEVTIPIQRAKEVNVNVITTGRLPAGVFEKSISSLPDKVTIVGSEAAVNSINSMDTVPVSLDNITGSAVRTVKLNIPSGVKVSGDISEVSVSISVESTASKAFTVPVSYINLPAGLKADIVTNTISVTLTGRQSVLDSLNPSDISVLLDFANIPAEDGQYDITPTVTVPEGVAKKDVSPQKVTVKITMKQG